MKIKKTIIIYFLVLCLLVSFISATVWERFGSNEEMSFVYDDTNRVLGESLVWYSSTLDDRTTRTTIITDLDDNGLNEIVMVLWGIDPYRDRVDLISGVDLNLIASYNNSNISINTEILAFDWDEDNDIEIIFGNSLYNQVMVLSWDGTNWDLEKTFRMEIPHQNNDIAAFGCADLYGDSSIECCVFGIAGAPPTEMMCANYEDDNFTEKYSHSAFFPTEAVQKSILSFIDADDDGDLDIFIQAENYPTGITDYNTLRYIENDGDGTFSDGYLLGTGTWVDFDGISKANLDGGTKELVTLHSHDCIDNTNCIFGSWEYSHIKITDISNGDLICEYFFDDYSDVSPYLTGLHTGTTEDDTDYNDDGYDDIYVFAYYGNTYSPKLYVLDGDCNVLYSHVITEISPSTLTGEDTTLHAFTNKNGIWANFDGDSDYEFYFDGTIINKDGSVVRQIYENLNAEYQNQYSYAILGDLNNDGYDEIIEQNTTDMVVFYTPSVATNCTDTDGGFDVDVQGNITTPTAFKQDSCADDFQLREYICDIGFPEGYSYSMYYCMGGCANGECITPQGATCYNYDSGQYVNETFRYCSQDYSKECLVDGSWLSVYCPLGCIDGDCSALTCTDTDDGNQIYIKGTVVLGNQTLTDFCVDGNLTEYRCYKPVYSPYEVRENTVVCFDECLNGACEGFHGIWDLYDIGEPCSGNGECITGNCEYGFCAYKGSGENCNYDIQCLSEKCINGRCTKPAYWKSIDASKTQQFGDDTNTNNFIALFFIVGIPAGIIWYGRSLSAGFAGIGIFFFLSIFFAIVGWLSPFILLGNIIMGLIVVVFMFMLKGSAD